MFNTILNWWHNVDENYKRILLAVLFSITVILLGIAIYYVFFRPTTPLEGPGDLAGIPGELPISDLRDLLEERGIPLEPEDISELPASLPVPPDRIARGRETLATPIIYTAARDVTIGSDGALYYYDELTGTFYTIGPNGALIPLSKQNFPDIQEITWSPKSTEAILEFPDGSNILYNFHTDQQYTLPPEGQDFNFSSTGEKISYEFITENPDNNWLIVSDATGKSATAVEHIGSANADDIQTEWSPDNTKVAFFRNSSSTSTEEIFLVGQNRENFKSLDVNGRGFEGLWSPQGDRLLYNVYNAGNGYRPELWTTSAKDTNLGVGNRSLGLNTWVDKCTFSDNAIAYCAVPLYLEQGSGIYEQLADIVPDTIYKINIRTGFKQQIAIPTNDLGVGLYTAKQLLLSPDKNTLYLVDINGGIYEIQLE